MVSGLSDRLSSAVAYATVSSLLSKNVKIHGRRTSVRLEPGMWNALCEIADWEKCTIHQICTEVYDSKEDRASFTAALRVFLMAYYRSALLVDRQVDKIRRNLNDKTRAMKEKDNRYSIDKELEFSS